jgi:hypothetical protein
MPQGKLKKKTVYFLKMVPGPLPKEDFEKRLVRSRHRLACAPRRHCDLAARAVLHAALTLR